MVRNLEYSCKICKYKWETLEPALKCPRCKSGDIKRDKSKDKEK